MATEEPRPCPVPTCIVEGLNDLDDLRAHLIGEHTEEERLAAGQDLVVREIADEVEAGEAHLMTRNELAEFIAWYNKRTGDGDFLLATEAENKRAAKEWFVKCEYEKAEDSGFGRDPVHREGRKWYFWDEVWADRIGPYDTEEIAHRELDHYIASALDGRKPDDHEHVDPS